MNQSKFKTEQEEFWAGQFGDDYIARNDDSSLVASNIALFSRILADIESIRSMIEFGANIGLNLQAIKQLLPSCELSAIEINQKAVAELRRWGEKEIKIYPQSILDFKLDYSRDLVLIKGVLVHTHPDELPAVYHLLYRASGRYICLVEYYNQAPVEITYRGHSKRLFKRDFAGEMLDIFPNLKLLDYGFVYHRDTSFPQDDCTWFLLEKTN